MKIIIALVAGCVLFLLLGAACKSPKNLAGDSIDQPVQKEKITQLPAFTPKAGSIPKGCIRLAGILLDDVQENNPVRFQIKEVLGFGATFAGYRPVEGDVFTLTLPEEKSSLPLDKPLIVDVMTSPIAGRNKKMAQWVQLIELK